MVRSGGKPYRKASQKGRNGGKTRRQQLSEKLQEKRRYLRENNLVELQCHTKPATLANTDIPLAVYGIYKDDDAKYDEQWVLTALAVTDETETMNHHRGGGYSSLEVQGRYVLDRTHRNDAVNPKNGLEVERFEKKSDAMKKIRADGSNRTENGYLVRPSHNPKTLHTVQFDKSNWSQFKRNALRVREE